jgi:hypothetical protein
MKFITKALPILFIATLPILTGCKMPWDSSSDEGSAGGDDTGSGGALTASDLSGDWDTPCIAAGTMQGPTGAAGYRDWLSVSGTSFSYIRAWYSTMTNGFCTGTVEMDSTLSGSIAVAGLVSGSSSLNSVQFTITGASLRGYTNGTRTILNTACTLALNSSTGVSVLGNSCSGGGYTANPSNGAQVDNVVTQTASNQIMMGAMATSMYIPGVLTGNTVALSATVLFIKR